MMMVQEQVAVAEANTALLDPGQTAAAEPVDRQPNAQAVPGDAAATAAHMAGDTYMRYLRWKAEPLTAQPYLSIVIPAYNESERIVPTIGAIAAYVCNLEKPWELLIADDGSKDNTVALCDELELTNLRVLKAPQNGGKGSAVQRGMLSARGQVVLFADADNSTPIEELGAMLQKIDQGYDIVIGSRAASGAQEAHRSLLRRTMSATLRGMIRPIFNLNVSDTQCGFKLFRCAVAQRLFGAQTIMGFSFDLEILYLANKWGYKIGEQPVTWIDAPGSKVDSKKEIKRFLKDMWRIKTNDFKGVYANK